MIEKNGKEKKCIHIVLPLPYRKYAIKTGSSQRRVPVSIATEGHFTPEIVASGGKAVWVLTSGEAMTLRLRENRIINSFS